MLDDSQPKYLNTAETPLFHDLHVVFGLDFAQQAIRAADRVIIVEGYMDVIAAHQHGFANVVACMGTALTSEQLRQLQRFTSNFVLALDADAAGQAATIRGLNQARMALTRVSKPTVQPGGHLQLTEQLSANVDSGCPDGLDPDDVIRHNPSQWLQLVNQSTPLVDFYFSVVAQRFDLTGAAGKATAVSELAPLIAPGRRRRASALCPPVEPVGADRRSGDRQPGEGSGSHCTVAADAAEARTKARARRRIGVQGTGRPSAAGGDGTAGS